MTVKRGDLSFILDAMREARKYIENPERMEEYEIVDIIVQAIMSIQDVEDDALEAGVLE